MTFEEICKKQPVIGTIINEMGYLSAKTGYFEPYTAGKNILSELVGFGAQDADLRNASDYDVVLERLADACEK
jgi:hypothetical protein